MAKALIIGAGNIGRGFLAEILVQSGYEFTFCDVNAEIINVLNERKQYDINYLGTERKKTIAGFGAVNSASEKEKYQKAVDEADLIMTAIGVNLLPKISEQLASAMNVKPRARTLMACENAIRASSQWKKEMDKYLSADCAAQTVFVDVAVDRIVPAVRLQNGDVGVEPYKELVADITINQTKANLQGIKVAEQSLDSYINRKLFCVNATHAYIAWLGISAGKKYIHEAIAEPAIKARAEALQKELIAVLVVENGLNKGETEDYCRETLHRFANAALMDTVERVGRGVLRKIAPNDRFVTPLGIAIERKLPHQELALAIKKAAQVQVPGDTESEQLQKEVKQEGMAKALAKATGLPETTFA